MRPIRFSRLGNKYGAKKASYGGYIYHSKAEAKYAEELDYLKKAKKIKNWERQVRMPLKVNNKLITTYIIDFKVENLDGTVTYIECKGFLTNEARIKMKLFDALLPAIDKNATFEIAWR